MLPTMYYIIERRTNRTKKLGSGRSFVHLWSDQTIIIRWNKKKNHLKTTQEYVFIYGTSISVNDGPNREIYIWTHPPTKERLVKCLLRSFLCSPLARNVCCHVVPEVGVGGHLPKLPPVQDEGGEVVLTRVHHVTLGSTWKKTKASRLVIHLSH